MGHWASISDSSSQYLHLPAFVQQTIRGDEPNLTVFLSLSVSLSFFLSRFLSLLRFSQSCCMAFSCSLALIADQLGILVWCASLWGQVDLSAGAGGMRFSTECSRQMQLEGQSAHLSAIIGEGLMLNRWLYERAAIAKDVLLLEAPMK